MSETTKPDNKTLLAVEEPGGGFIIPGGGYIIRNVSPMPVTVEGHTFTVTLPPGASLRTDEHGRYQMALDPT